VRGSGPEKFYPPRLREPFAPFGAGVAASTASFAWTVLTGLAAFAGAYAAAVLASLPLMSLSIREISARSAALLQAGAIPLPSPAESRRATGARRTGARFAASGRLLRRARPFGPALRPPTCRSAPPASPGVVSLRRSSSALALFPVLPVLALPLALQSRSPRSSARRSSGPGGASGVRKGPPRDSPFSSA
jgi:hypothetical protein